MLYPIIHLRGKDIEVQLHIVKISTTVLFFCKWTTHSTRRNSSFSHLEALVKTIREYFGKNYDADIRQAITRN